MITHPRDIEYFAEYPAPIMEQVHSMHFTNVNSTITFFGPMIYFLIRALGCEQVLEIGHAEGYTAFYMANAVKDNGTRFGMKDNRYYGIDIAQTEKTRQRLLDKNLPATVLNLDSMKLTPESFKGINFDLIFQDGAHDTEHILYEMDVMYPRLKSNGYWLFHDAAGPAEEGWHEVKKLITKGKYQFEYVRILSVYGLGVLHKIEGMNPEERYWRK